MLIYISDEITQSVISNNKTSINAINIISLGRRHGKHILLSSRNNLKILKNCNQLNNDSIAVFSHLYENYPIIASIISKLSFYVKIVNGQNHMNLFTENNTNILELSSDYFQDINIVTETVVIAENQSEIDFYEYISEYYKGINGLSLIPCNFNPMMGGGSTSHTVYSHEQEKENRFCLCLADSDKLHPKSKLGNTVKLLLKADDETKKLSHLHYLTVREIENLIPLSILERVCKDDINHNKGLESFKKILTSSNYKDYLFLDIKKGLTLVNYRKIMDVNLKSFLDSILINSGLFTKKDLTKISKGEISRDVLIQGLGNNVLDRAIEYLKLDDASYQSNFDFEEQISEWLTIGEKFTNWTCGSERIF